MSKYRIHTLQHVRYRCEYEVEADSPEEAERIFWEDEEQVTEILAYPTVVDSEEVLSVELIEEDE